MAHQNVDTTDTSDPLVHLPSEVVLRIIKHATIDSVAKLTQLTKTWHAFIEESHQDAIYSSRSKTQRPSQAKPKDLSVVDTPLHYSEYYSNIQSWKDLCRRQTLLKKNWKRERPITREATIQTGNDPIWRFRPDFKRRIFISTSQTGGLNVTDMDSGNLLWRLDAQTVIDHAHLEYEDGTAVWDRPGNAIEVWKTDIEGADLAKGEFKQVVILNPDRPTRGFQLTNNTLCVVSSEERGYVYDLSGEPKLLREIEIDSGAGGHLDQDARVVVYSLGIEGYHFFDKESGAQLGVLHPEQTIHTYHILHPQTLPCSRSVTRAYPPKVSDPDRTVPIQVKTGNHPPIRATWPIALEDDEWGAGMLDGDLFAGVSRGGRVFICSNWRKALTDTASFQKVTANIECDSDGQTFDDGGWLAVRAHKLMFENQDMVYIVSLNDDNTIKAFDESPQRPSYAYATSSSPRLVDPVSYMGIYNDCVMGTYTTYRDLRNIEFDIEGRPVVRIRSLPAKVIRVLSFAPKFKNPEIGQEEEESEEEDEWEDEDEDESESDEDTNSSLEEIDRP